MRRAFVTAWIFGLVINASVAAQEAVSHTAYRVRSGATLPSACINSVLVTDVFVLKAGGASDGYYFCSGSTFTGPVSVGAAGTYLLATGATTGATSQAQAFTLGAVSTTAASGSLGSALLPFKYAYLAGDSGTPATNNFKITGTSSSGTRVLNIVDAANSYSAQATAAVSNQFLTAFLSTGAFTQAQPAFSNLSGSATCAQLPALTGDTTTSAGNCATTVVKVDGVTYAAAPATNTIPVITAANTATYTAIGDCQDSGGNHLNFNATTHVISCGTSSGAGGSAPFSDATALVKNASDATKTVTIDASAVTTGNNLTIAAKGTAAAPLFGIGTTSPAYTIEVVGDTDAIETGGSLVRGVISTQISSDTNSAHFGGRKARGTTSVPTAVQNSDYITVLAAQPYDGTSYLLPALAGFRVSGAVSAGVAPTDFVVNTGTGAGDGTERMRITSGGIVQINTGETYSTLDVVAYAGGFNAVRGTNNSSTYSASYFQNNSATGVGVYSVAPLNTFTGAIKTGTSCSVATDQTNATTTLQTAACYNTTSGSVAMSLVGGKTYAGQCELFLSDSVAADGAKMDFNGGTATATNFRAQVTAFDTALNLSSQVTALNSASSATTFTGAGAFEVHLTFKVNAAGTFQPQFAQVGHTTGTLTLAAGSYCKLEDVTP